MLNFILRKIPDPYSVVQISLNAYFTTYHDHSAFGIENIPSKGALIFAANHTSYYDPPVIGIKSPRKINYMARDTLFKGFFGTCLESIGTIPVSRGTADVKSIKSIFKALKKGEATAIFPEGTRSIDGKIKSPQAGIGMIAIKSKAQVIPTRIFGAFEAFGKKPALPTLGTPIQVIYGKPLNFDTLDSGVNNPERYLIASQKIMNAIKEINPIKTTIH